jgi:hypothetical protein
VVDGGWMVEIETVLFLPIHRLLQMVVQGGDFGIGGTDPSDKSGFPDLQQGRTRRLCRHSRRPPAVSTSATHLVVSFLYDGFLS